MTKREFLDQLAFQLRDISEEERREALDYYTEYIEDAGYENEESTVDGLGSVVELAKEIKAGLSNKTEERKENEIVIKKGTYSSVNQSAVRDNNYSERKKEKKSMSALAIILLILTFPIWFPVGATVLGLLFGLGIAVIAIAFAFGVTTFALMIAGIAIVGTAITKLIIAPIVGIALMGVGLLLTGLALLIFVITVGLFTVAIPACFKMIGSFINWCGRKLRGEN